jgi:hypothetical protein
MPSILIYLGDRAFYNCTSLVSINIPISVDYFGVLVLFGCSHLTTAIINAPITEIPYGTFWGCTSLSSVSFPENIIKFTVMLLMDVQV